MFEILPVRTTFHVTNHFSMYSKYPHSKNVYNKDQPKRENKFLDQKSDRSNSLETHLYRCELQQAWGMLPTGVLIQNIYKHDTREY